MWQIVAIVSRKVLSGNAFCLKSVGFQRLGGRKTAPARIKLKPKRFPNFQAEPPAFYMADQFIQVTTTTASVEEARQIAQALVERRLAACVQIVGPVESVFRWEGKLEMAAEWQCVIKTTLARYGVVEQAIRRHHSYEVPEIIATEIVDGSEDYLRWLRESLG
jgi:periplasmic divalent cation tolerance protein